METDSPNLYGPSETSDKYEKTEVIGKMDAANPHIISSRLGSPTLEHCPEG